MFAQTISQKLHMVIITEGLHSIMINVVEYGSLIWRTQTLQLRTFGFC